MTLFCSRCHEKGWRLKEELDTQRKAKEAALSLLDERTVALDKLRRIGRLLEDNGCDCECGCDSDGHDDQCEICLACRIGEVWDEPAHCE